MYPSLYHAFLDLLGVDWPALKLINSFGFFVALAFLAASWTLTRELKRKSAEGLLPIEKRKRTIGKPPAWGDIAFSAFISFIFGWKIIYLVINAGELFQPPNRPQDFIFSHHGYAWLGLLFAVASAGRKYWWAKKHQLDTPKEEIVEFHKWEYTGNITLIAAVGGILGAKLFHLLESPDEFMQFFKEPSVDNFLSGLTIYGGLIIGGITVWLYARSVKIPMPHLMDAAAPGLMLSYGIGRIGCHVSGDGDWGIANTNPNPGWLPDWLWSYAYPNNVNAVRFFDPEGGYTGKRIPKVDPECQDPVCEGLLHGESIDVFEGYGTYLDPGVYPTPVYETIAATIIFLILWRLRKKFQVPLMLFAAYLMFNGLERFFIEKIRVNNTMQLFGIEVTQAEVISTIFFLSGALLFYILWRKREWFTKRYGPITTQAPADGGGSPEPQGG